MSDLSGTELNAEISRLLNGGAPNPEHWRTRTGGMRWIPGMSSTAGQYKYDESSYFAGPCYSSDPIRAVGFLVEMAEAGAEPHAWVTRIGGVDGYQVLWYDLADKHVELSRTRLCPGFGPESFCLAVCRAWVAWKSSAMSQASSPSETPHNSTEVPS